MTESPYFALFIYAFLFIFGGSVIGFLLGFYAGQVKGHVDTISEFDQENFGREESVCR